MHYLKNVVNICNPVFFFLFQNSPDFIANNLTKFYELASVTFGLEAAWYAYEQHAALYGETNEKLPQAIYNKMPEYDNEQLFFVSFGNVREQIRTVYTGAKQTIVTNSPLCEASACMNLRVQRLREYL